MDIASSHIIVSEWGTFLKPNGEKFLFNKENVMNEKDLLLLINLTKNY